MWVEPLGITASAEELSLRLTGAPGLVWLDGDGRFGSAGELSFVASHPVEVRTRRISDDDPLDAFSDLDTRPEADAAEGPPAALIPRHIGYVAYDAAWAGATAEAARIGRSPDAMTVWLGRYEALAAFDHGTRAAWIVGDDPSACARFRSRIERTAVPSAIPQASVGAPAVGPAEQHLSAIGAALEHIAAGDIYQVNLARRWVADFAGSPLGLWRAMRRASPVPFGMYLDAGDHAVLARTMETFLRWDRKSRRLTSRPIKGTIARAGADEQEAHALRSDDKERAEHAMIVDLMRNDLGRVAETGTVQVHDVMSVEPYAKLAHLVSTITCETARGTRIDDVLRATFPPGSVTGAPKIRAMEIIEQLEPCPRGIYTGCVGYVDRAGGMTFAVAIRTAQISGGKVTYHAGGGLVAASVPEREVAETELKARAFLDAVEALDGPTEDPAEDLTPVPAPPGGA